MKTLLLALCLTLLSIPAHAQWGSFGSKQRKLETAFSAGTGAPLQIFDQDCADTNDTPATTDGTDVSDVTNWDTRAEAVDVLGNLGDAVQTTGSADGWCDATPWVIKANWTTAGDEELFIGPFLLPANGLYIHWSSPTIITDYDIIWQFDNTWAATETVFASVLNVSESASDLVYLFAPTALAAGHDELDDYNVNPMPNRPLYLQVGLDGAGAWLINMELFHAR